jgi:hypothetical protein
VDADERSLLLLSLLLVFSAVAYAAEDAVFSVSSLLESDTVFKVAACGLATFLFLFTASTYERSGKPALAYMSAAFLLFALKFFVLLFDVFRSVRASQLADVLDLAAVLFLFVAVLKTWQR